MFLFLTYYIAVFRFCKSSNEKLQKSTKTRSPKGGGNLNLTNPSRKSCETGRRLQERLLFRANALPQAAAQAPSGKASSQPRASGFSLLRKSKMNSRPAENASRRRPGAARLGLMKDDRPPGRFAPKISGFLEMPAHFCYNECRQPEIRDIRREAGDIVMIRPGHIDPDKYLRYTGRPGAVFQRNDGRGLAHENTI